MRRKPPVQKPLFLIPGAIFLRGFDNPSDMIRGDRCGNGAVRAEDQPPGGSEIVDQLFRIIFDLLLGSRVQDALRTVIKSAYTGFSAKEFPPFGKGKLLDKDRPVDRLDRYVFPEGQAFFNPAQAQRWLIL